MSDEITGGIPELTKEQVHRIIVLDLEELFESLKSTIHDNDIFYRELTTIENTLRYLGNLI